MAKILGKAGRFTLQAAASRRRRQLLLGISVIGLLGVVEGMCLSTLWSFFQLPAWLCRVLLYVPAGAALVLTKWGWYKLDELEAERANWQRGTEGETVVGKILADFPEDYYVFNDISTPTGNLDHVVVGPTGVFVLDAKNWRGVVQADGKGELLLNGKRTDKADIRSFVGRIMGVREKVRNLAGGADLYFHGVFVFTAARVEAAWGKTGSVHCLREDQLREYIVEKEFGKRLIPAEVEKMAKAFLGLAHMDRDFTDKATQGITHKAVWAAAVEIGQVRRRVTSR